MCFTETPSITSQKSINHHTVSALTHTKMWSHISPQVQEFLPKRLARQGTYRPLCEWHLISVKAHWKIRWKEQHEHIAVLLRPKSTIRTLCALKRHYECEQRPQGCQYKCVIWNGAIVLVAITKVNKWTSIKSIHIKNLLQNKDATEIVNTT